MSITTGNPQYRSFVARQVTCKRCAGSGRVLVQEIGRPRTTSGDGFHAFCPTCGGYGFTAELIDDEQRKPLLTDDA